MTLAADHNLARILRTFSSGLVRPLTPEIVTSARIRVACPLLSVPVEDHARGIGHSVSDGNVACLLSFEIRLAVKSNSNDLSPEDQYRYVLDMTSSDALSFRVLKIP